MSNCSSVASIITAILTQNNLWPCISSALLVSTCDSYPHPLAVKLSAILLEEPHEEWRRLECEADCRLLNNVFS